ncbi:MAG TPA: hypothetical protein PLH19_14060 [Anaerolineae bacterium]|nr:hypothetical protein [Anaerolineae bacterium]HQH39640.1 hypothetical protein [Anaerolineae bacterium]
MKRIASARFVLVIALLATLVSSSLGAAASGVAPAAQNPELVAQLGGDSNAKVTAKSNSDEISPRVYLALVLSSYGNTITDIVFDPPSPASLKYWDPINITFKYTTVYTGGVRMWAIGYANDQRQPYTGSDLYPGPSSGVTTRSITVFGATGTVVIDRVEFIMRTQEGVTLVEFNVPVEYTYTP